MRALQYYFLTLAFTVLLTGLKSFELEETETTVQSQATSMWSSMPHDDWFRLMPSAADIATGTVHALLDADFNNIHVPFGFEVPAALDNPITPSQFFAQECNEAVRTALLNQGLQIMPATVADVVIVYDLDEVSAIEAAFAFRNRTMIGSSNPMAAIPIVILTPLSVSKEWGLWNVHDVAQSLAPQELMLLNAGPVYHATAFATPTRSHLDDVDNLLSNISYTVVNASLSEIRAVGSEIEDRLEVGNAVSASVEWMSMAVGPVGWSEIGFCGQGLRHVYLPQLVLGLERSGRDWLSEVELMEGTTAILGSCGAARVLPPHYRGVVLLYSGLTSTDFSRALQQEMHDVTIHNRRLRVQFVDDGYNPQVTAENVNRSISSHPPALGIAGIYGTPTAAMALSIIKGYSENHDVGDIPMFGAMTGSPLLRDPYQRNVINTRASMADEAFAMVNALQEWGRLRVAMLYLATSFGTQGVAAINASLNAAGGVLLHAVGTPNGAAQQEYVEALDSLVGAIGDEVPLACVLWHADQAVLTLTTLIRNRYGKEPLIMVTSTGGGMAAMEGLRGELRHNVYFARVVAPQRDANRSNWLTQEGYLTAAIIVQAARTAFDEAEVFYSTAGSNQSPLLSMQPLGMSGNEAIDPFFSEAKNAIERLRAEMIDAVYFHKYFSSTYLAEEDILGPFTSSCNQGTQALYITGINAEGGDSTLFRSVSLECNEGAMSATWTIPVGATLPLTGNGRAGALEVVRGLEASVAAINSETVIPGFSLSLTVLDDGGDSLMLASNIETLVTNHSVAALLTPLSVDAVDVITSTCEAFDLPLIGALSGSQELRRPYNPLFVNVRAGIQDEVQLMINHAMLASQTRVALIYPETALGFHVKESLEISLANQGLRIHALVPYTEGNETSASLISRLQAASGLTPPQALLTVTNEAVSAGIVHGIRELWPLAGVSVYSLASFHAENYLELLKTNTDSVYFTGMVPDPRGSTEVATAYRKYLQRSCGTSCEASFQGLEAFVALMALAQTMESVDPMVLRSLNQPLTAPGTKAANRRALANTVYDMGLLTVYDLRLGPYGPACENDVGCSCNQGARKVYLYEASTEEKTRYVEVDGVREVFAFTENSWQPHDEDTLFFDTCGVPAVALPVDQRPIVFGQSVDLTTVAGRALAAGVRLAFAHVNRGGGVRGRGLRVVSYDDAGNGTMASQNARDMMDRHGVFGFIGFGGLRPDPVHEAFRYITQTYPTVPFIAADSPSVLLRNPVTPTSITVTSGLQEEATAAVRFARSLGRTRIAIINERTAAGDDALASMRKAVEFYRSIVVTNTSYFVERSTAMAVVDLLTATPAPDAVLFYGDTESFVNILLSYYDAQGFNTAAPPVEDHRHVLFIGMSVVSILKTTQLLPTPFQHSAFVANGLPVAWGQESLRLLDTMIADIAIEADPETTQLLNEEGTRMFNGYIGARLATLILERSPAVSRQGFVDTVYATQMFTVEDQRLGPYYYNHIGGSSDCSMGMRKVTIESVLTYTRWLAPSASNYDFYSNYTMDLSDSLSCGVYTDFSRPPCSPGFERVYTTNDTEAFFCRECERGFYSADGLQCLPCAPGSFSTSSRTAQCSLCPPGHYQDRPEQSQCLPCDTSSFAAGYGNSACSSCGRNALTRTTASVSSSACVCLGGYYGNALADSTASNNGCRACPEGGNCCAYPVDRLGRVLPEEWMRRTNSSSSLDVCDLGVTDPVPLPGYIESTVIAAGIVRCRSKEACRGVLDYTARNTTSRCMDGYGGIHCGTCEEGYYRFYGECLACGTETVQWFRVGGMLIFFTILILTSVEFSARKSTYSGLSLLLNFLQIMGLLNDFWMTWPSMLQSFVGFSALVNLQLDMFAPECKLQDLFPVDFFERLTMWLTLPFLLLLCYVLTFFIAISIVYGLQSCFANRKKRRQRRERRETGLSTNGGGTESNSPTSISVSRSISRTLSIKKYQCCGKRCSREAVHRFLGVSRLYSMDLPSTIKVFRSAYFRVIVAIYPVLLSRSLSMFRCVNLEDGVSVLEGYYSEICYSDRWWSNVHLGIIGTLVYGVGMPALLFSLLYRARQNRIKREVRRRALQFYTTTHTGTDLGNSSNHDSSDSEIDQHFVKRVPSKFDLKQAKKEAASMATLGLVGHYHSIWPFVIDYRPLAWYWALMEQLEFIGIVVASTFVQLPTAQLLIALLTIGSFCVAMLIVKPYDHSTFNRLEVVNDLVQVALIMIGISFVANPPTAEESTLNGFSVFLIVCAGLGIAYGFYADLRIKVANWRMMRSFAVVRGRQHWVNKTLPSEGGSPRSLPRTQSAKVAPAPPTASSDIPMKNPIMALRPLQTFLEDQNSTSEFKPANQHKATPPLHAESFTPGIGRLAEQQETDSLRHSDTNLSLSASEKGSRSSRNVRLGASKGETSAALSATAEGIRNDFSPEETFSSHRKSDLDAEVVDQVDKLIEHLSEG